MKSGPFRGGKRRSGRADPVDVKSGHVLKDPVAGHELQVQHDGGGGDPAVGVVDLLGEGMARAARFGASRGAPVDERLARPDDIEVGERPLQPPEAKLTPAGPESAVPEFGHGDERRDATMPADDATSRLSVRQRARIEEPAGNVGVDDDVRAPSSLDHASARAA